MKLRPQFGTWLSIAFVTLILFSTSSADASCGEVTVAKGDVKVTNGKTKKVSAVESGAKVCQGDTIVAGPLSRAKVVMADGNELNISPDSRIEIEEYVYKPADNKKKVMLNVLYGKVRTATKEENMYGDKAKDGQANTFQVKTKSAVAGVRGTDFLTSFDRRTSRSEVVTFRGRVEVGTPGANGAILNSVMVGAGQKTEAMPGQPPAEPKAVPKQEMDRVNNESKPDAAQGARSGGNESNSADSNANDANATDTGSGDAKNQDRKDDGAGQGGTGASGGDRKGRTAGGSEGRDGDRDGAAGSRPGSNRGNDRGPDSLSPGDSRGSDTAGQTPPQRSPASMIDMGDLGKSPNQSPALPAMPTVPIFAPPILTQLPVVSPICDLCNRAIESGPGKVKITITIPQ